ncbi:mannose-1-phosphate guanyltransferase [Planomonospora parontospora subsp. parontospora]|uniref:Mannose-1-phosphate guanyltransferase n=2 Tax=Planomonospora parontospora TaxID=58119 RepID=A0AA37F673_9ACTN|nr:mannose-1-phosphate guanyltransferase [Planomonospora parontospora]GGK82497.1 mannose-1-phosphate guanyltransferase [Planomonospora parontospora]GII10934.1 mannose-1-phosphate guanyltransferase [Planomonospora parontospora subsp. parontospora]
MKAVVMAGGEGTRLRPMTANQPKPLLPVVNRPIMEHVLRLLKRHGFTETVVTVQFLAALVRTYFGDGDELGMDLYYATEETPLGTAGSVKNAADELRDDRFLVISGDALTDIDLTDMVRFHREQGALVTIGLKRVPNPLEFGIVIADERGRVERFLEKPTWGQVFSDTVNTGIYVMEPEILDEVAAGEPVDWSADVFPRLLARGAPIFGYVAEGYWEDVGTHESYLAVQADVLSGRVAVDLGAFELSPGVWVAEGAVVDPDAVLKGPLYIGDYAKVEAGAELREYTVLGSNAVVREGAFLHRAVVHDNVYVGPGVHLRGCVIGKNSDLMTGARIEESAVIGDECVIEAEAYVSSGVKVYPFKTVEAGAVVNTSVIWESRGQRSLFGPRGVSGLVNVEITPELCVRLASAYATTLRKGASVVTSRDSSRAARALKRAVISALNASAINVLDLEATPLPVSRFHTAKENAVGGIALRTTAGDPQSVDIVFMDDSGADLSRSAQRKLERVFSRQEFRRAFPGEIAELGFPPRAVEDYTHELLRRVDMTGVRDADMKVVVDCAGGTSSLVLPSLLGRAGVDVLTVNNRLDEASPTETFAERRRDLQRLAELVGSSRAAFGVRFDPVGERVSLVNETGQLISEERALLVVLDLVAAERRGGRVALPVTTTRVAEQVCRFHGVQVEWTSTALDALTAASRAPDMVFAGDGRGGFIVPEFGPAVDGLAVFLRLLGLVARTRLSLSQIDARIPVARLLRRTVPTPWAAKGAVMRSVIEAAERQRIDTTDGVRVVGEDGSWTLVLPDPSEAVTHLWAEGSDADSAQVLLEHWARIVERAAGP